MVKTVRIRTMEQCFRGIMGLERPRYACSQPKYVDRGMLTEVSCPRYVYRGTKPWMADCGCRGVIPRPTEQMSIARISYSLCRGRSISPYPRWTWFGSPDYPGIAMPGYGSQRFSLSSSVCYGIAEDGEVPVGGVLHNYL